MAKFELLTLEQQRKVKAIADMKGVPVSAVIAALEVITLDKFTGPNKSNTGAS